MGWFRLSIGKLEEHGIIHNLYVIGTSVSSGIRLFTPTRSKSALSYSISHCPEIWLFAVTREQIFCPGRVCFVVEGIRCSYHCDKRRMMENSSVGVPYLDRSYLPWPLAIRCFDVTQIVTNIYWAGCVLLRAPGAVISIVVSIFKASISYETFQRRCSPFVPLLFPGLISLMSFSRVIVLALLFAEIQIPGKWEMNKKTIDVPLWKNPRPFITKWRLILHMRACLPLLRC
jgi:hypothetical protein